MASAALATGLQVAACLSGNCDPLIHFWLYWIAPVVGALFAALAFALIDSEAVKAEDEGDEY